MKAMLLAAGRGERLRPLTKTMPKPLLKVGPYRLIEYNIQKLKAAGINHIVINISYLAKKIIRYLGDGSRYGVTIQYSFEGSECLGTGGGIYRALPLLGEEPFWVISADIWSDFSFLKKPITKNTNAHLIMVNNPDFHQDGDYCILDNQQLSKAGEKQTFAGIACLHPDFFSSCKTGTYSLSPVINQAIQKGSVTGELYKGPWFNVGTAKELNNLKRYLYQ